jgi:Na+-translocating ferredoxin:NAD+ oxidoreductase RNF subunit RnfB
MDEELCVGCESCIDRCHFGALSMKEGIAQVNEDYCMGCGLCVSTCSTGAISLIRKPEELLVSPPPDLETLYAQIGKEKGRTEAIVE